MRLWHSLGLSYWHTQGSSPQAAHAFQQTRDLAHRLRNVEFERMSLYGMWLERHGSGDYAGSLALARKHAALTPPGTEFEVVILTRRMMVLALHYMGDQSATREEAVAALGLIRSDQHRALGLMQLDPHASINAILSRALWIQGLPAQALDMAVEAVRSARSTQHALTLCLALHGHCSVLLWCGSWEELGRQADSLMEAARDRRLGYWKAWAQTFKDAHAYGAQGVVVPQWRNAVCGPPQLETMATVSDELLDGEALVRAENGQCTWCAPEVLRAHGEKLLRQGSSPRDVEPWFVRSLDLARSSKALSWELRAATSLARCWAAQDRRNEARALLASLLERYTEGHDTQDVQRAWQMLQA